MDFKDKHLSTYLKSLLLLYLLKHPNDIISILFSMRLTAIKPISRKQKLNELPRGRAIEVSK